MLLCGFMHPNPIKKFDLEALPEIVFYKINEVVPGLVYKEGVWIPKRFDYDRFLYDGHFARGKNFLSA